MAAPLLPSPIPYFSGPSDVGALRNYLNELIRQVNAILGYLAQIIVVGLKAYRSVSANYTIVAGDAVVDVDASVGAVTITYPPALSPFSDFAQVVRVNKVDTSSNAVFISNGSGVIDQIVTAASVDGQVGGWRDIFGNGTTLRSAGVG